MLSRILVIVGAVGAVELTGDVVQVPVPGTVDDLSWPVAVVLVAVVLSRWKPPAIKIDLFLNKHDDRP